MPWCRHHTVNPHVTEAVHDEADLVRKPQACADGCLVTHPRRRILHLSNIAAIAQPCPMHINLNHAGISPLTER